MIYGNFVAETKDKTLLRESERMKIKCGEKHFAEFSNEEVQYKVVGSLGDL